MASVTIRITPAAHKILKALAKLHKRTLSAQFYALVLAERERTKTVATAMNTMGQSSEAQS